MAPIKKLYGWFLKAAASLQSPFLLAVRLYWGWQFAQNGWAKLHNLENVTNYFASLGLPMPGTTAVVISSTELLGGVLLALGLFSPIVSLVLAGDMIGAYVTADRVALFSIFSEPGKFYNADPFTLLFASLIVLIFGAGKVSVDALLERMASKRGNA